MKNLTLKILKIYHLHFAHLDRSRNRCVSPRFYYSVTDNRGSVGNTAETFKLTADITTLSGGEFLKLISSEDTVWVLQNNAPKTETVISYAKKALSNLANSLKDKIIFQYCRLHSAVFYT